MLDIDILVNILFEYSHIQEEHNHTLYRYFSLPRFSLPRFGLPRFSFCQHDMVVRWICENRLDDRNDCTFLKNIPQKHYVILCNSLHYMIHHHNNTNRYMFVNDIDFVKCNRIFNKIKEVVEVF